MTTTTAASTITANRGLTSQASTTSTAATGAATPMTLPAETGSGFFSGWRADAGSRGG